MADMWLPIMSTNVDLSKHVGHKVTIAGAGAMPMAMAKDMATSKSMDMSNFTVKTLTMVSSSCTQ
jgi:hypothetical protein